MPYIDIPNPTSTGGRPVQASKANPFPMYLPSYESGNNLPFTEVRDTADLIDVLERIQQQLGLMTEVRLDPGDRL